MSKHTGKLASSIRRVLAPFCLECPQKCGIVVITEVEVTSDKSLATIFLSAIDHPEEALSFFNNKQSQLRSKVSQLSLKHVPELRFKIDPRTEKGSRIEKLLEQ